MKNTTAYSPQSTCNSGTGNHNTETQKNEGGHGVQRVLENEAHSSVFEF